MIQILLILFRIKTPTFFRSIRINMFNFLLIDDLTLSFRTIGHSFSGVEKNERDILSIILSYFILSCYTFELLYMLEKVNHPKLLEANEEGDHEEWQLKEMFLEGLDIEICSKCWFTRNYNFLHLLRFYSFTHLVVNLQYLEFFQIIFSSASIISLSIATFIYVKKQRVFENEWEERLRVLQEVTMVLLMVLVMIFWFNTKFYLYVKIVNTFLVFLFCILIIMNICFELLSISIKFIITVNEMLQGGEELLIVVEDHPQQKAKNEDISILDNESFQDLNKNEIKIEKSGSDFRLSSRRKLIDSSRIDSLFLIEKEASLQNEKLNKVGLKEFEGNESAQKSPKLKTAVRRLEYVI